MRTIKKKVMILLVKNLKKKNQNNYIIYIYIRICEEEIIILYLKYITRLIHIIYKVIITKRTLLLYIFTCRSCVRVVCYVMIYFMHNIRHIMYDLCRFLKKIRGFRAMT